MRADVARYWSLVIGAYRPITGYSSTTTVAPPALRYEVSTHPKGGVRTVRTRMPHRRPPPVGKQRRTLACDLAVSATERVIIADR